MAKLITVFGATGGQGKAVAEALLGDSDYKVRALTRNPDSSGAKGLAEKGCEVVKVDMDDADSLEKAISGSYGVFAVTNYMGMLTENPQNPTAAMEHEIKQGKTIGDICKRVGVKHLVYSGLEHVQAIIGKPCRFFDSKGIVEKYLDKIEVPNTSTRLASYYENFINFPPQKNEDGTYTMTWPMDGPMDAVSVCDLGPAVVTVFKNPDTYIGKKPGLSGDKLTLRDYAAIMSEVTGKTLTHKQASLEVYSKFPFPAAEDMAAMFEFCRVGNPDRDVALTRTLNPNTATFRQWAEKNKDRLLA